MANFSVILREKSVHDEACTPSHYSLDLEKKAVSAATKIHEQFITTREKNSTYTRKYNRAGYDRKIINFWVVIASN